MRADVKTIVKFAQLEFKLGDAERGRTIFEGIMDSYPKRLDLWFVYVDMEIKQRNVAGVRALFDRILASRLSSSASLALPLLPLPPLPLLLRLALSLALFTLPRARSTLQGRPHRALELTCRTDLSFSLPPPARREGQVGVQEVAYVREGARR